MRGSDPNDRPFGEYMMGLALVTRPVHGGLITPLPIIDRMSFASKMTFASGLICECRRACSLRGCCGCRGFRIGAHCRNKHRRGASDRSRFFGVLRPRLGGMPDRLVGGKPSCRRALRRRAAGSFQKAWACLSLARLVQGFRKSPFSRVAMSTNDRGCWAAALTRSLSLT
jgi:hypothetical protein